MSTNFEPPIVTGTMNAVRYSENQWIGDLEQTVREKAEHKLSKYSCERTEREVSDTIDKITVELSALRERVSIIQQEEKQREELYSKQATELSSLEKEEDVFKRTFESMLNIDIEEFSDDSAHAVFKELESNIQAAFDKAKQNLEDVHSSAQQALSNNTSDNEDNTIGDTNTVDFEENGDKT